MVGPHECALHLRQREVGRQLEVGPHDFRNSLQRFSSEVLSAWPIVFLGCVMFYVFKNPQLPMAKSLCLNRRFWVVGEDGLERKERGESTERVKEILLRGATI